MRRKGPPPLARDQSVGYARRTTSFRSTRGWAALLWASVGVIGLMGLPTAGAQVDPHRSFHRLVSSNGHAVVSYDRQTRRIDTFLEHPYRFVEPRNMPEDLCYEADESRDLAYDLYFGVRHGAAGTWLPEAALDDAGYEVGTNIIRTEQHVGASRGLRVVTHSWLPTTLEKPVLVMVAEVTNETSSAQDVSLYALFNMRLGAAGGGREPGAGQEQVATAAGVFYEYSDASEGTVAYVPLSSFVNRTASTGAQSAYARLSAGLDLDGSSATAGPTDDVAPGLQAATVTLGPGESTSAAVAIVWALDEDAAPDVAEVRTWAAARTPAQLVQAERDAWAAWHTPPPSGLSAAQRDLWLQSNAVLRMGQVREPGRGFGQILASLPPGLGNIDAQWNIAWVRDMAYAVVGLLRAGHLAEAEAALRFQIEAGPGERTAEAGGAYRISATRYFGNGREETDCNANGPNVEFDGFGLYLWTVGEYLRAGGDLATVRAWWSELETGVADVLVRLTDDDGIIAADSSIWEVHWNGQQKRFTYTSLAAARGLCDAAAIAERLGETADATRFAAAGARIRDAVIERHTDARHALAQSREDLERGTGYIDAAAVEAVNWGVASPTGEVAHATLDAILDNLTVDTGFGFMRNDDGGWYDSQEWVFVDFRVLPVLRASGRPDDAVRADRLQEWLEEMALRNDLQFSELHEAETGDYAGSIPMVGFGAGAYLVALEGSLADAACGAYGDGAAMPGMDAGPVDLGVTQDLGTGPDSGGPSAGDLGAVGDGGADMGAGVDAGFCFGDCTEDGCGCALAGVPARDRDPRWLLLFGAALLWRRRR